MEHLIAWCGFLGAWALVAGPIFQAAVELGEEDVHTDRLRGRGDELDSALPPVSPWWWLLPPVRYWLSRRRQRALRKQFMESLAPEELDALLSFINKARGWMIVAGGAALIAVKETWELAELNEWPHAVFWVLVVVMALACLGYTASWVSRTRGVLDRPATP